MRNVFVSVDPYMRGRMTGVRTYVAPYELGEVVDGQAVGRVVASRHDGFAEGDWVLSMLGWRERGVAAGDRLRKLDPALAPPSTALGVLGMPGLTAWVGLVDVGRVQEGETLYVSGAAGAVGLDRGADREAQGPARDRQRRLGREGRVAPVARHRGVRLRQTPPRRRSPTGSTSTSTTSAATQLESALFALRPFGRVVACGAISRYNDAGPQPGPRNLAPDRHASGSASRGSSCSTTSNASATFVEEVGPWVRDGKVVYRETIVEGSTTAPHAFSGLFRGDNVGKMLVRVGPD